MTTMIALVGEQPLPNFLPVRHYHLENILLVHTGQKSREYNYLEATLKQETYLKVHELETGAYDIPEIAREIDAKLEYLLDKKTITLPLIFNLTGGTKPMSLAAYRVAQLRCAPMIYVQSEGKDTRIYHSSWADPNTFQTEPTEIVPGCITLHDVFNLHLGPGNWKEYGPSTDAKNSGAPFERLLANILRAQKYEVMSGVRTLAMKDQAEVDVAVRIGNQYGIIEAKTGNAGRGLKGIQQLSTNVTLLGTYSRTFHVITCGPNPDHQALKDALRILDISLLSYDPTTNTISADDEIELLTRIEAALNGASGAPYAYS